MLAAIYAEDLDSIDAHKIANEGAPMPPTSHGGDFGGMGAGMGSGLGTGLGIDPGMHDPSIPPIN